MASRAGAGDDRAPFSTPPPARWNSSPACIPWFTPVEAERTLLYGDRRTSPPSPFPPRAILPEKAGRSPAGKAQLDVSCAGSRDAHLREPGIHPGQIHPVPRRPDGTAQRLPGQLAGDFDPLRLHAREDERGKGDSPGGDGTARRERRGSTARRGPGRRSGRSRPASFPGCMPRKGRFAPRRLPSGAPHSPYAGGRSRPPPGSPNRPEISSYAALRRVAVTCRGYPFPSPSRAVRFAAATRSPSAARFLPRPVMEPSRRPSCQRTHPSARSSPAVSGDQPTQIADLCVKCQPFAEVPRRVDVESLSLQEPGGRCGDRRSAKSAWSSPVRACPCRRLSRRLPLTSPRSGA